MKKLFSLLFVSAIIALSLSSCMSGLFFEKGNGNIVRNEVATQQFTEIVLNGFGDVIIEQGSKNQLFIETDDNLMQFIEVKFENNQLILDATETIAPTKLKFYIMAPNINGIKINGAGDVLAKYPISSNDFKIDIKGSGDVRMNEIKFERLDINISGSGDVTLAGKASDSRISIVGSGDIKCKELEVKNCNAKIVGSGDIKINVVEGLNASITGSGDILYYGDPKVLTSSVSGSGEIKRATK